MPKKVYSQYFLPLPSYLDEAHRIDKIVPQSISLLEQVGKAIERGAMEEEIGTTSFGT